MCRTVFLPWNWVTDKGLPASIEGKDWKGKGWPTLKSAAFALPARQTAAAAMARL